MKNHSLSASIAALAAACLVLPVAHAQSTPKDKKEDPNAYWYGQAQIGRTGSASQTLNVALGGPVKLTGEAEFGGSSTFSLVIGRQSVRDEQDAQRKSDPNAQERRAWRVEGELWSSSLKRESVKLGALSFNPNDSVDARVLFLNGLMTLTQSDQKEKNGQPLWRTWVGGGIGYAKLSYDSAAAASNCNCLAAASGSGAAYQLKIAVERQLSDSAMGFVQFAHVRLPGANSGSGAFPQTDYGRIGVNAVTVGVRAAF